MTSTPVDLLRQLIRNACVNDGSAGSGHEQRSVETLIDFLGQPGDVIETAPGRQSLVYRIKGPEETAPTLALLGHLDVVPVDDSGWTVDPFAAEVSDGFVWGRGAVDMLNLVAAMATVFRPHLHGEVALPGDLVFIATADEESGGAYGAKHLVDSHWDLVQADCVLCEVAYPPIGTAEGAVFPVVVGEKGPHWTALTARGSPGHGSAPYGADNALALMIEAVDGLSSTREPVVITDEWRLFVSGLGLDSDWSRLS